MPRTTPPSTAFSSATVPQKVRVWDLPTRLFHWLLALGVVGLIVTAKTGGNAMVWHLWLGHAVMALLLFRLVWGLFGGYWSRFVQFIYTPASTLRYLRGQGTVREHVGHSPMGALSVFAMLASLILQVASGLVSDDEIAFAGPLARFASGELVGTASNYHVHWGQYVLYVLLALHLLAVAYYTWKKRGILRAMVSGDKTLSAAESRAQPPLPSSRDTAMTRIAALVLVMVCAVVAWWIHTLSAF
jgi:cytochrome b